MGGFVNRLVHFVFVSWTIHLVCTSTRDISISRVPIYVGITDCVSVYRKYKPPCINNDFVLNGFRNLALF